MKAKRSSNIVDLESRRNESREQLLERLFQEHGAAVRSFLRARTTEPADLDDLVQEVFTKLAAMDDLRQRLSPRRGSNRSFILTTANNLFVDRERAKAVRKRYRDEHMDQESQRVDELSPELMAEDAQVLAAVREAIVNLKPNHRWVFVQSRIKYKSYRQIAEEMGVSVKQIDKYMAKALSVVREAAKRAREI